jgi:hypothetical protein
VQDFVKSPTEISKFLGLGEVYGPTDPGRDQLCPWVFFHIEEHVKLYILSGGGINPEGSWVFGAGVWKFPHRNFEIFGFGGTICTHRSMYRPAMTIGVPTYQRARQTTYSIRWLALLDEI